MNIEELRDYCLSFPQTSESLPFDENTLVFKVHGKMFVLSDIESFSFINLKCDPEKAVEVREKYSAVTPGYHMNKKHWNSVRVDGDLSDKKIEQWVTDSYNLVVANMPKKLKIELDKF